MLVEAARQADNCASVCAGHSGGRCLYVSGVPGTGKTATVLEVMRSLRRKTESGQLPAFQFVELNSLRLPSPQHAYSHLYEVRYFKWPVLVTYVLKYS